MKSKMKLLALLLFISSMAFAQERGRGRGNQNNKSPEEMAKARTEKMATELSLTPEQKDKIYQLKLNRINAVKAARTTTPPNKEAMKAANKTYSESVKALLTPEQLEKAKARMQEHKEKREEHKGKGGEHREKGGEHKEYKGEKAPKGAKPAESDDDEDEKLSF